MIALSENTSGAGDMSITVYRAAPAIDRLVELPTWAAVSKAAHRDILHTVLQPIATPRLGAELWQRERLETLS